MRKTTILIVDDHPMLRGGIISLIQKQEDMEVVGEADSSEMAVQKAHELCPDVVVMDINMNGAIDFRSTEIIRVKCPQTKVVAFSMHNEVNIVRRMLKAGATAYITKSAPHGELLKAIRSVANGETYFDEQVLETVTTALGEQTDDIEDINLSARENEVLLYVSKEFTNQEIADRMEISLRTVETHKRNLIKKLRVKNVVGLARFAMDNSHYFDK